MTNDSQLSELQNQVKLKAFEAERTQLVHEETCHILKQTQLDNEKLTSKLEVCQLHPQQKSEEMHGFVRGG